MSRRARAVRVGCGAAALVAVALSAAPAAAGGFADPLDTPASDSPLASRRLLNGICGTAEGIVAVGQRGHILASHDGGATWRQAKVPVSTDLTAVWFTSPLRGWAVGHAGVVLSTEDGGYTWVKRLDRRHVQRLLSAYRADPEACRAPGLCEQLDILSAADSDVSFLDVWFADELDGFVVGAFNLMLRTRDGGRTWVPWLHRVPNGGGLHLQAIRRAGGRVFVAGERGLLLRLGARGEAFERVAAPTEGSLFGIVGDDRIALVFGLGGRAFRTSDGGERWQRVDTGVDDALAAGAVLPDGSFVLATRAGELLVSRDGGASFRRGAPRGGAASAVVAAGAAGDAVVVAGASGVRVERVRWP